MSGIRRDREEDDQNFTPLLTQHNSMSSVSSSRFLSESRSVAPDDRNPYNVNQD